MYILKDWAIIESESTADNHYLAPELRKCYLIGRVYDQPGRNDGKPITTSSIVEWVEGTRLIRTRNSTYRLEKPKDDFVRYIKKDNPNWKYRHLLEWEENVPV